MKLFYWTECEYDACNHYAAFAEDVDEAKALVIEGIQKSWESVNENDTTHAEWMKTHTQNEINSFLNDPKWSLTVYEVKHGFVSFGEY
jgi:hypothetical protein